jgi:hypothetical protein
MTRYGAVLNFSGPFPDGDGICDLTARVSKDTRVLRAAYATLGSQVPKQLFFQHSSCLNEQATVNGLVGHAQALVIGILGFQPSEICSGDQSRISLLATIFCNFTWMERRHRLGRKADSPGFAVGLVGSIHRTAVHGFLLSD